MNHLNSKPDTVWRSQNAVFSAASKLFVILNVTYWCRTTLMKHIVHGGWWRLRLLVTRAAELPDRHRLESGLM